jgi:amino acid transporter
MHKNFLGQLAPIITIFLTLTLVLFFAVGSVHAAGLVEQVGERATFQQEPEPPEPPEPPEITIVPVPENGDDTVVFFTDWLIWIILGVIIIALLVALVARGGGTGHHHHE